MMVNIFPILGNLIHLFNGTKNGIPGKWFSNKRLDTNALCHFPVCRSIVSRDHDEICSRLVFSDLFYEACSQAIWQVIVEKYNAKGSGRQDQFLRFPQVPGKHRMDIPLP